jgi:hypothetical protein
LVRRVSKTLAGVLAVFLLSVGFAACGGGSDNSSSSPTETVQGGPEAAKEKVEAKVKGLKEKHAAGDKGAQNGGENDEGEGGAKKKAAVPPLKVSGGGSGQFRSKGGDNSIQNYGEESDEEELQEAAEALHAFYVARSEERWERACSYLTKTVSKEFEQLGSRSPKLKGAGCGGVLQALTRPLPASIEREITEVNAASLRREGERAFLIYKGLENKAYAISMSQEDGVWKVGSVSATPIN